MQIKTGVWPFVFWSNYLNLFPLGSEVWYVYRNLSLVLVGFPIFLPTPCPKKQTAHAQQSSGHVRDEVFGLLLLSPKHWWWHADSLPFTLLSWQLRHLAWSSLISPVPYPVTSFIVGNLNLPEWRFTIIKLSVCPLFNLDEWNIPGLSLQFLLHLPARVINICTNHNVPTVLLPQSYF